MRSRPVGAFLSSSVVLWFRDAAWLTPDRATGYAWVFLVVGVVWIVARTLLSQMGVSPLGVPLRADFIIFWTASKLVLAGRPSAAYDMAAHWAEERTLFAGTTYFAFFYPPIFLLMCLPLALLPYFWSLTVWLSITGYMYWRCIRTILPGIALPILAYPGVFMNVVYGQNGFLTTALFGTAVLSLRQRPICAGVCCGFLLYKPQFVPVVPLVLIAERHWVTLITAGVTACVLIGLSVTVFGSASWFAFLGAAPLARATLERGLIDDANWESVFSAARLLHNNIVLAYGAQCIVAVVACWMLLVLLRARPQCSAGVAMVAAALMITPFLLVYDLMLLAVPMAWLFREGQRTGFLPWEKLVLVLGFILPLMSPLAVHYARLPVGPVVVISVFAAICRRILLEPTALEDSETRMPRVTI